jgi:gas vesicle protein
MEKHNGKFVAGMVSGALMGAVMALLMAPKTGKETRNVIRSKAGDVGTSFKQRCGRHSEADAVEDQLAEDWQRAA